MSPISLVALDRHRCRSAAVAFVLSSIRLTWSRVALDETHFVSRTMQCYADEESLSGGGCRAIFVRPPMT